MGLCYSPMSQERYTLDLPGRPLAFRNTVSYGLGDDSIVTYPELWNYCAMTSRLLFLWEDTTTKKVDLPMRFPNLGLAKLDMKLLIGSESVRVHMNSNPDRFSQCVDEFPVKHLNICKFYKSERAFRMVVKARAAVWKLAKGMYISNDEEAIIAMVNHDI